MARKGKNPAKNVLSEPPKYSDISVATITFVPELRGYWKNYKDIIELMLLSIKINTDMDHDVVLFDNGSCDEFVDHLRWLEHIGLIDILILSKVNYGKVRAMNFLMRAVCSELILFSDSDVFFDRGWLEEHIKVYQTCKNKGIKVGMISGYPVFGLQTPKTLLQVYQEYGMDINEWDIDEEILLVYLRDLGRSAKEIEQELNNIKNINHYVLEMDGTRFVPGARHMQFLMPSNVANEVFPIDAKYYLGGKGEDKDDRKIDRAVDELGYLKFSTFRPVIRHVGTDLDGYMKQQLDNLRSVYSEKSRGKRRDQESDLKWQKNKDLAKFFLRRASHNIKRFFRKCSITG